MAKTSKTNEAFESITRINMRVINTTIKIRDLVKGYVDKSLDEEGGITSMNGRLNIRPKYQRAYIVDEKSCWRENLINSIICGFPINRIYIGVDVEEYKNKSLEDCALEMLDGQQRTKTICDFINHGFSIDIDGMPYYFDGLKEKAEDILDYGVDITYCIGNQEARVAWFKRINQPNSILVPQELRNASYVGPWLEEAKKHFSATSSRTNKPMNQKDYKYYAGNYSSGRSIERSEFLELAIDWAAYDKYPELRKDEDKRILKYMADHQNDSNANELIKHYETVIDWANDVFFHNGTPSSKGWQSVRSQEWGRLYAEYKNLELTDEQKSYISKRTAEIVGYGAAIYQKSDGIYEWVLRGEKEDEIAKYLHLRNFTPEDKSARYNAQGGIDPIDGKHYEFDEMEAHHIKSWRNGGDSKYDNLVMLSAENHAKYHAGDFPITAETLKAKRDYICKN